MEASTNSKTPTTVRDVREQRRLVEAQIELTKLQRSQKILEALSLWDDDFGGSDLWARLRDQDGQRWLPLSLPSDRRHGANWPLWRTEPELDELRQKSRVICSINAYARGLLRNLTNYVIGKGFSYKARLHDDLAAGADDVAGAERQLRWQREAQSCINEFLRRNRWNGTIDPFGNWVMAGSRERETFRRVKRDGEAFLRLYFLDDGCTQVRFVEPEQVRNPPGRTYIDGWTYGIQHRMKPFEDIETPEVYHLYWQDPTTPQGAEKSPIGEFVPASEIMHLKGADTDSGVKRGLPEFTYDVGEALSRASKLQRNLSMGAAIRAATAEIWKHNVGTSAQIASLADTLKAYDRTNTTSGLNERVEQVVPGMIRRIPKDQEPVWPPSSVGTAEQQEVVQGDLRQGGSAFCAPEYWTGDASNGNYSSLESASAPAVKAGETEQEYFKSAFVRVIWRALQHSVAVGKIDKEVLDCIEIQVEAPAVLHRNELEKAQADQIRILNGWKSRQTVAMEEGTDPETEFVNNEEYNDRFGVGVPLDLKGDPLIEPEDAGNDRSVRARALRVGS